MRQWAWLVLILSFSAPVLAIERIQGDCTGGGYQVNVPSAGGQSTTPSGVPTYWLQDFPSCLVTVYNSGTLVKAILYSDNASPPTPLGNPFNSQSIGSATPGHWFFYAPNGRYDVQFSAGGIASPFTYGDYLLNDPGLISINCTQFGTTGDIAAVINACINALPAVGGTADASQLIGPLSLSSDMFTGVTKPVTILFGQATYAVTTTQFMTPNIRLICNGGPEGAGTLFVNNTSNASIFASEDYAVHSTGTNGDEISGCAFDNNGQGRTTNTFVFPVHIRGSFNSIHDNFFTDSIAGGSSQCSGGNGSCAVAIRIEGWPVPTQVQSTENDITNNTITAVNIGISLAALANHNTVHKNRLVGDYEAFDLNGDKISGNNIYTFHNIISDNHIEGETIPSFIQTATYTVVNGNSFSNMASASDSSYMVVTTSIGSGDFSDTVISNNVFGDPVGINPINCLKIGDNVSGFTITGNFFRSCGNDGLVLAPSGASQSVIDGMISGNIFSSNGTASCGSNWGGIGLAPATGGMVSRINITGNVSYDLGATGLGSAPAPCQGYGVRIGSTGTVSNIQINSNDLSPNVAGAIGGAGSCSACSIGINREDTSGISYVRTPWSFVFNPTFASGLALTSPALTTPAIGGGGAITLVTRFNLTSAVVGSQSVGANACVDFGLSPSVPSVTTTDLAVVSPAYTPTTGTDGRLQWSAYVQNGVNVFVRLCNPTATPATTAAGAAFTIWLFR